jgi:hypothetical protein
MAQQSERVQQPVQQQEPARATLQERVQVQVQEQQPVQEPRRRARDDRCSRGRLRA